MDDAFTKVLILIEKELAEIIEERDAPIDYSIHPEIREQNGLYHFGREQCAKALLGKIKQLENKTYKDNLTKERSDGIHS